MSSGSTSRPDRAKRSAIRRPPTSFRVDRHAAVGEYRIDVTVGELDSIAVSRTFVVRDAAGGAFEVRPFAVPTQPFGLRLRLDAGALGVAKVFVDDVQVAPISRSTARTGSRHPRTRAASRT